MQPLFLGFLFLFSTTLLATALGFRVLRWSRFETWDPYSKGILSLGLGLGLLQFIPFSLLVAGVGTPPVIRAAVALAGLFLVPDMVNIIRRVWKEVRKPWRLLWWEWTLVGIVNILFLLIFVRSVLPAADIDVLSYHLTAPLRLFEQGRFFHILTVTPTNWPMAIEFLYGTLLTLDPEAPVAVVPFLLGVATSGLVCLFAVRIGTRGAASIAIVLLMAQSTFWWEMTTGMIDIAAAFFALLSLFVLETAGDGPTPRSSLILSAVFAGFAATTKLQGLWVIAAIMVVIVLRKKNHGYAPALRECLIFGLLAAAVVLPWYLKTWIVTGNPVYPLFFEVFGGNELSAPGSDRYVEVYRLIDAFHGLPSSMSLTPATISLYHLIRFGVAIIVAAFIVSLSRRSRSASLLSFAAVFTVLICAASSFHMRFLLPAYVAAITGASRFFHKTSRTLGVLVNIAALIYVLWISETRLQPDLSFSWSVATGRTGREEYFRASRVREYGTMMFANHNLPSGSRILVGTENENTAMLQHESFWANYWLQDSFHYESLDRLLADLRRIGISHLILVDRFPPWFENHVAWRKRADVEHPMLKELASRFGRELFSDRGTSLFELSLPEERQALKE